MVLVSPLCAREDLERNNGLCQHLCLGESCSSISCPGLVQFSSSPYVPGALQVAAAVLELKGSKSM